MSFARAPLKRFNEHVGCAPPPGTYDIKPGDPKGTASFDKSDRFRPVKSACAADLLPPSSPSRNVFASPVRRTLSADGLVTGASSAKKERSCIPFELKQQKLLEREIRSLVQQRGELDRRVLVLEEELKKVEAKLLAAVREKTGLTASVVTLERQQAELKKINEFLKNKVSTDTTKKRINSLTMELMEARNNLDAKNQELSLLQMNSEGQLNALEMDLQAAKAAVSSLVDRNKDLEELHLETKSQNDESENENARLNAVIQELREEIRVLQRYLDEANDQIQELRLKIEEKTMESFQLEKQNQLEMQLEQRTSELETTRVLLRQKEEDAQKFQKDLQASKEALREAEQRLEYQETELNVAKKAVADMEKQMRLTRQEVQDSQATVHQQEAELARLREVLRRTERELGERVAHLEQRCLFSEEERNKTQEDGLRRIEELKMELNLLQQANRDEKKRQIQLEQEHETLTEELTKEKALVDSLTTLVEQEREESEQQMGQLKEEMEEILGDLAVMEEQELKRQEVAEKSQEVIENLLQEKEQLKQQLSSLLEGDGVSMTELHLATVRELQEANADSQRKMEDLVSELESTKEDLRGAKESRRELEAEVERVTRQLMEAMNKMVEHKEEEVKKLKEWTTEHQERLLAEAKAEENSKVLLEVQARLALKEEEMKAAEASHAAQVAQLQKELQLHIHEREETLSRLEEQRNKSLTLLQHEREEAQKVLEETSRQKAEIIKQLQEEREEKDKIHKALEEEKESLEVERKNHEQVRSEVQSLHAELVKLNKERESSLSEVKLQEFSRVLENQLNTAERDRDQFRARLDDTEQEKVGLQAQLNLVQEKAQAVVHELEHHGRENLTLREQVEVLSQEKVTLQWDIMEEQRRQLQTQLSEAQETSCSCAELERWKEQYEELFAKVRPFQEQLNAFAAERAVLLNENGTNQEELNKLANAYASLLGHHNQKQKIKHVMKLKDENVSLKQELSKLRSLVSRHKSDLEQLKAKLPGAARPRFDPSKAFQHDKENRGAETTKPLKEGN